MQQRSCPIKRAPVAARQSAWRLVRTLRSPESGLVGQGLRYAIAGATVAIINLATTLVLADVVGLPFQAALAIGFACAITAHFTLQRTFVWIHHSEFALALHHQALRYLLNAGTQYGLTALSTALLPSLLGAATEAVYLATLALLVGANFLIFRHGIFHAQPTPEAARTATPQALERACGGSSDQR
jgi:putative flippase GtrA